MSNIENLKESLTSLSRKNPTLVQHILSIRETGELQDFKLENTQKGELNLFYNKKYSPFALHDPHGATAEASKAVKSINTSSQVIYLFGVGLGYTFVYLKKWLEQNSSHFLVFLEPHLAVFFHLFQTEIGVKIAKHPQVHLYHFTRRRDLNYLMEYLGCYFSLLQPAFDTLPSYEKAYPHLSNYIRESLPQRQEMVSTRLIESSVSSKQAFLNYVKKFPYMSGHTNASAFRNLFKNVPCIICGAGPSLKKNVHLLKELKNKALILAGSSAVPALMHSKVHPHFANFFDPYPRVHERFLNTTDFELPTFHCARTYHETSRWIHGPKLYTKGSDDTPFVDWIENELGFKGDLVKEYISVTAYNTSIALLMGCDPIIYVGVDLAYTDNQTYMSGVNKEFEFKASSEAEGESWEFNREILTQDIYGEPITTRFGWQVESQFMSDIVRPFQNSVKIINSTEGGIGFPQIPNIALEDVAEQLLTRSYPFEDWIHASLIPHLVNDPGIKSRYTQLIKEFKQSLGRLEKIYQSVVREIKRLSQCNKKTPHFEYDEQFIKEAEEKISEEIGYQYYMVHHHQIIDINRLKTHNLLFELSSDAPKTLLNEVHLSRALDRFSSYLKYCKMYKSIVTQSITEHERDPW